VVASFGATGGARGKRWLFRPRAFDTIPATS